MSRSVDLFIASDEPITGLAALIAERSGLALRARADGEGFDLADGDLAAVLHRHAFADDDGLPLSRYPYAISMQTQAGGHLGASLEVSLLRRLASRLDGLAVLLVLDLQNRADLNGRADDVDGAVDEPGQAGE
jgi:hypothetical protein